MKGLQGEGEDVFVCFTPYFEKDERSVLHIDHEGRAISAKFNPFAKLFPRMFDAAHEEVEGLLENIPPQQQNNHSSPLLSSPLLSTTKRKQTIIQDRN